jgi:hypothetical protein
VASTVGNMVADQLKSQPTSTEMRTQQAIAAVSDQVLLSVVGVGGNGIVPTTRGMTDPPTSGEMLSSGQLQPSKKDLFRRWRG